MPPVVLWTVQSPKSGCVRTFRNFTKARAFMLKLIREYGQMPNDGFYVRSLTREEVSAHGWKHACARADIDESRKRGT